MKTIFLIACLLNSIPVLSQSPQEVLDCLFTSDEGKFNVTIDYEKLTIVDADCETEIILKNIRNFEKKPGLDRTSYLVINCNGSKPCVTQVCFQQIFPPKKWLPLDILNNKCDIEECLKVLNKVLEK